MRTKEQEIETYQESQQSNALEASIERSRVSFSSSVYIPHRGANSIVHTGLQLSGYFSNSRTSSQLQAEDGKSPPQPGQAKPPPKKWTRHQKGTLAAVLFVDFCACLCISILAPFFPREAEMKGISPAAYGLVFGVFSFVILVLSPIYGKYINVIGTKLLFNVGTLITGLCIIAFGLLDMVPPGDPFLYVAMFIRIIGAFGDAAIFCASYVIMPHLFPESVATVYAAVESAFALGLIAGPAIGGFLYEIGGYVTPFAVNGACLTLSAAVTFFLLPSIPRTAPDNDNKSMLRMLRIPSVLLYGLVTYASAFSGGFIAALLQPHLKQFGLSPSLEGLVFAVNGIVYAFTAPLWGLYCDRTKSYSVPCLVSVLFMVFSWALLGPCDFLPIPTTLTLNILALAAYGVAWAGELIAAAAGITAGVISDGFPDNVETFGLVSGLINAMFALGACTGPIIAGYTFDKLGFRHASMVVFYLHVFVAILLAVSIYNNRGKKKIVPRRQATREPSESDPLLISGPI